MKSIRAHARLTIAEGVNRASKQKFRRNFSAEHFVAQLAELWTEER